MRLLEKLNLTHIVILLAVMMTAVFSYVQAYRTRVFLEHTMNEVEEARRTVSRIQDLQDQYAHLLLLAAFRSPGADPTELNELDRKSEIESKSLGTPFSESVRGAKLVADYSSSRRTLRSLQMKIQSAIDNKNSPEEIGRKFEAWRWAERFNDARLRDLAGYLAARELDAIAQLTSLARFGFVTLVALFLVTLVVLSASAVYFFKTLVRPLRRLERCVKEVAGGKLGIRLGPKTHDEVGSLTKSFNLLTERLEMRSEELAKAKASIKKFTSVAVNDLRSPLSSILSFQKILTRPDLAPKRRKELTHLVGEIADRSLKIVDAMLAQAVQESREFEPRDIDAETELRGIVNDLTPELAASGGQVEIGALPRVTADREQFQQLFRNLISNALKYQKPGVPPQVQVTGRTIEVKGKKMHQFDVADNGTGFDDRRQEELFAPYESAAQPGRGSRSAVGLAVCKKIVERHGGTIRARSRGGDGSVFTVQIPQDLSGHSS